MIPNRAFEVNKIRRTIKTMGAPYTFTRKTVNEYKEPTTGESPAGIIQGVYHEAYARTTIVRQDGSQLRSLPQPAILCLWDDYNAAGLAVGDTVKIGRNLYELHGVVDVQKMGVAADIILKMVDDDGVSF